MAAESAPGACVICLDELGAERVPLEPCGHDQFHPDCLVRAMRQNPACPICRDGAPPSPREPASGDAEMVVGLEFRDVPSQYRHHIESMLENIATNVAEEIDHELTADNARRARRRHNRRARLDPEVARARDRFWDARRARQTAERQLRDICRPLDREMNELVAKHRRQTESARSRLASMRQAENVAEARFRQAAE